jgi:hypothetical protein
MLDFDIRGNLLAVPIVKNISVAEFRTYFVTDFEDNAIRLALFEAFNNYIADWQAHITTDFQQWIDGSFVTTKREPNDLDVLTFIDYQDYERCKYLVENQFTAIRTKVIGIDAYVIKTYPIEHPLYPIYQADYLYWLNHFGHTRLNRHKKQFQKGIIQLNFKK